MSSAAWRDVRVGRQHSIGDAPALDLVIYILNGIPLPLRETWVKKYLPKTHALLATSALFVPPVQHSQTRNMAQVKTGSMQRPIRGAYL